MDFVTESFRKDETAITPKSEDKYVVKVFNWSEFIFQKMTCYKIHTLITRIALILVSNFFNHK